LRAPRKLFAAKQAKTSLALVLLAIVALASLGGLAYYVALPALTQTATPELPSLPTTGTTPSSGVYSGNIDLSVDVYDSFDPATKYTDGTNHNVYWYRYSNGAWVNLGSNDVTGAEVQPEDNGYLYVVLPVPPKSGQAYYWDVDKIDDLSTRVTYYGYMDVDNDGVKEYVLKYWVGDKKITEAGYPDTTFIGYMRAYEKPSLTGPSDISSVGTSETTKYVEWYESYSNTKKSTLVSKVELKFNSTDETKLKRTDSALYIPGLGYVSLSQFDYSEDGSNVIYSYTIGNTVADALRQDYGTNQLNKFEYTAKLKVDLAANDVIGFTLTITHLDTTGSPTTNADEVALSA